LFSVLSAIDFDGGAQSRAVEVEREGTDRMLPPEMKAIQLIATQCVPEKRFSISHVAAKLLCACGHFTRARET
jgi:hypothetical protein